METTYIMVFGLPGTGRSYHADEIFGRIIDKPKYAWNTGFIDDLDIRNKTFEEELRNEFNDADGGKCAYVIIDVNVSTLEEVKGLKKAIDRVSADYDVKPNYEVHLIRPDLDNAKVAYFIKHRKHNEDLDTIYQNWDIDAVGLVDLFGQIVIEHLETPKASRGDLAIYKSGNTHHLINDECIRSDSWVTDGWSRTWFHEDEYEFFDDAPNEFIELKEFLKDYLGDKYKEKYYEELFDKAKVIDDNYYEEWYAYYDYSYYEIPMDVVLDYLDDKLAS